jgi:hypothetical protein
LWPDATVEALADALHAQAGALLGPAAPPGASQPTVVVPWQTALNAMECLRRYLELPDHEDMDPDTTRHLATTAREACVSFSEALEAARCG